MWKSNGGEWLVDVVPPPVLQEIAHWTASFEEQNGALCWERILSEALNKDTEIQRTMRLKKKLELTSVSASMAQSRWPALFAI